MRHRYKKTGLRKTTGREKANVRNLLTALFRHEAIKTTRGRAKRVTPIAEKLINHVLTQDDKNAVRTLKKYITEREVGKKIMTELKPKFAKRKSGFVSSYTIGARDGDGAKMVQLQLNLDK